MSQRVPPIARIRLARSLPRLLLAPFVVALAGAASIAAGLLAVGGPGGGVLVVLGAFVALGAMLGAVVLLSVRLEVEESAVGLAWMGGERIYPLAPGAVTRVRLRGDDASRVRARTGALGWGLGRARLRGEEEIEIVRLAPTRTAILVPTERGRLAIAPANENQLLDALSRAARARQRLEALAERVPAAVEEAPPEPEPAAADPEAAPQALTGIQRAIRERQMAEERAAALSAPVVEPASAQVAEVEPPPAPAPATVPRSARGFLRRPRPRAAFVLLPMVGAGIAWAIGIATGRMPEAGTDLARLTALALVMAGPATSVGAIMALAWWPRIVGVVVAGGLAAAVFVGRALVGP